MKKNLKNLFTEDVQKVLTDETLTAIEEAFNSKVELSVEAALLEQDDQYTAKLKTLLDVLDKDRSKKMLKVVEAVDKNNASKLKKVITMYEKNGKKEFSKLKKVLVESISAYLDTFLEESSSKEDIKQAVKNKTAYNVLENLKAVLGVDSSMMNPEIQSAVLGSKKEIVRLQKENREFKEQFKALYEANQKTEVVNLIESKISKFPESKRNFIRKALTDKSPTFINENFDYTVRLFDKQEASKLQTLKEDAIEKREVKPDFAKIQKIVEEKVNNNNYENNLQSDYLNVLSRGKGMR